MAVSLAARRRLRGECPMCGGKPTEGYVHCDTCRSIKAERMVRYNKRHGYADAKRRYRERRAWWREIRSQYSCQECGEAHPATLDFHHRDPSQKLFTIAAAAASRMAKEKVLAEIEKCDVLCANCHRKLHWQE